MRILIAFDGSACAEAAINDLHRAGLPLDCEALVLTAADLMVELPFANVGYASIGANSPFDYVKLAREAAEARTAEAHRFAEYGAGVVRTAFPSWSVRCEVRADAPAAAIVAKSEQWAADLVVVGSQGRSLMSRVVMGSVSQAVLNHAPCSVRVARRDLRGAEPSANPKPIQLLLGVDGSIDAALAVEAVRSRTWPSGTRVRVVTGVDLRLAAMDFEGWVNANKHDRPLTYVARHRADLVVRELKDAGLEADAVVLEADPKHLLLEEAHRLQPDCIFVGAKGRSLLDRFFLGSVSRAVVSRAACTVEVVRNA